MSAFPQPCHPFQGEAHDNISAALTHAVEALEHLEAIRQLIECHLNKQEKANLKRSICRLREAQIYIEHLGT